MVLHKEANILTLNHFILHTQLKLFKSQMQGLHHAPTWPAH